jgi:universal stress protein A
MHGLGILRFRWQKKRKVNMSGYKKILVALDAYSTYEPVLERACKLASNIEDVSLIYATLPPVYFEPYGAAFRADYVEDMSKQTADKLKSIANIHGIPDSQIHLVMGYAADEIHKVAKQINADLIVIGTHGQSGLKLLLGSTANGVLHGVKRDVLAVKV